MAGESLGQASKIHPSGQAIGQDPGQTEPLLRPDSVEVALARAVTLAAEAGEWTVVAELGRQLAERERARTAPDVASLDRER
ncbi:MAG: hypothetical protein ABJB12_20705, partial [Pseudomonadota bacterium]